MTLQFISHSVLLVVRFSAAFFPVADGTTGSCLNPTAVPPRPTWGKMIDPQKQRRWEMLRRLQSGVRRGGKRIDSTAWARRSYCLSYAPIFQDGRPPGEWLK